MSCHTATDRHTMHQNPGVILGCTDCHGGDAKVERPKGAERQDPGYQAALEAAHVLPRYPKAWNWPSSANPEGSYTLLNREAPEYVRFVNPGDLRVAREACGACHLPIIQASESAASCRPRRCCGEAPPTTTASCRSSATSSARPTRATASAPRS